MWSLFAFCTTASTQQNDNYWISGHDANMDPSDQFCVSIINFDGGVFNMNINDSIPVDFSSINATYCNDNGELMTYFNGNTVYNRKHQIMDNGQNIDYNEDYDYAPYNTIMLDFPSTNKQKVFLLHARTDFLWAPANTITLSQVYYSIIDLTMDNGLGKVIEKNKNLFKDTLSYGKITAIKHGNGRDWWILINEFRTNNYYTLLLDPDGIHIQYKQQIGPVIPHSLGQSTFSPDGKTYVTVGSINVSEGCYVDIYDFDRCSGQLSNHRRHHWTGSDRSVGAAFSPNSRYLYVPAMTSVYQYDLQAPDWIASRVKVLEYDGFEAPFPTRFFGAWLAPDNKIYMSSTNGVNYIHTINEPNKAGLACQAEQHNIDIGCYSYLTIPNYPHYRLYDLQGSACDTLGINGPIVSVAPNPAPQPGFTVFPNPVSDRQLTISNETGVGFTARLYTLTGQCVFSDVSAGDTTVWHCQLPDLSAGLYLLELTTNQGRKTVVKLVIDRW